MPERRGMGLRGRLTLFFVAITVIPVMVAALIVQSELDSRLRARVETQLVTVTKAAASLAAGDRARAGDLASDLAMSLALDPAGLTLGEPGSSEVVDDFLAARAEPGRPMRADAVVVLGPDGGLLAHRGEDAVLADGTQLGSAEVVEAVATGRPLRGALLEVRELVGTAPAPLGWLVVVLWTDEQFLNQLAVSGPAALVSERTVLAVQGTSAEGVPTERAQPGSPVARETRDDEELLVTSEALVPEGAADAPLDLLIWVDGPNQPSPLVAALPIVLPSLVLAAAVGYFLATSLVAPIQRAAEVARAVAAGELNQRLEPSGGREVRDLTHALNQMSTELARRMTELQEREQQLRANLSRLGETLSSSLDANRTLSVVVDTARDTLRADRALLAVFTPERDALFTKVGRGLDGPGPRLRLGEGLIGGVARRGLAVLVPGSAEVPEHAPGEPRGRSQLAVPMIVRGRVLGVLSLLRDSEPFTEDDLETLRSFATQAAVAIENVLLHQEAQRLSVTDPLTGLWNFRYFQLQANREAEAAARSGRPLSLIVVDIDRFKQVNDRYGHQVGDEVLIEVAARLRDSTRVPDIVARYGGEEFVVLLPDTDLEGATATAERIHAGVGQTPVGPGASPLVPGDPSTRVPAPPGRKQVSFPPLHVTCSVGVATLPDSGGTVAGLLQAADAAMYQAKQHGRDRVVVADA